jgi:hypothetical protein
MSILDDFERGINAFSPFALKSEKQFAQRVGPALASAMGNITSTAMAGNAGLEQEFTRGKMQQQTAVMRDKGDTLRSNILADANKLMTQMQQSGANWREQYGQNAQTARTESTLSSDRWKDMKRRRHESDMLDQRFNLSQSILGKGGTVDPGAILDIVEPQGRTSAGDVPAIPANEDRRSWIDSLFGNDFEY